MIELSHPGALFPWRTINGEESSAYLLTGTAQYHFNADITYVLKKFTEVASDLDLLWDIGMETAIETARIWADFGLYRAGRSHIHGGDRARRVLHPRPRQRLHHARMNPRFAADAVVQLRSERPGLRSLLVNRVGLTDGVHMASIGGVWKALVFGLGGSAIIKVRSVSTPDSPPTGPTWPFTCNCTARRSI